MTAVHDLMIAVHAVTATVAFVAGCLVLLPRRPRGRWALRVWLVCLVVMAVSLVVAVAVGWPDLVAGERVTFPALLVLAGAMVWQAVTVATPRAGRTPDLRTTYARTGFTLISLFVGFVVVAVLRSGAPAWTSVAAGVGGIVVGRVIVHAATARAMGSAVPARA